MPGYVEIIASSIILICGTIYVAIYLLLNWGKVDYLSLAGLIMFMIGMVITLMGGEGWRYVGGLLLIASALIGWDDLRR